MQYAQRWGKSEPWMAENNKTHLTCGWGGQGACIGRRGRGRVAPLLAYLLIILYRESVNLTRHEYVFGGDKRFSA